MSPEVDPQATSLELAPLLALHKVQAGLSFGATNLPPRRLDNLINRLNEAGLPFRLSFDDGYRQLRDALPPLLPKLRFPPIIFMPTYWIGRENEWDYSYLFKHVGHLEESDIRELAELGVLFGSHGHTHRQLLDGSEAELEEELGLSRRILQGIIGRPVDCISYPFGRVDGRVMAAAEREGYRFGYTMSFPEPSDPPLAIGRIPVYTFDTPATIIRRLTRGRGYDWERLKVDITTSLSGGTVILNRLRGDRGSRSR